MSQLYRYFQIKPQAVFENQVQAFQIAVRDILVSFEAEIILSYKYNSSQLLSNFQILHQTVQFFIELGFFVRKWWFLCHKILFKCNWFSLAVHHSRFSTRLSVLIQFIWLIWDLFSGLGIKWFATSLWIVKFLEMLLLHNLTNAYQWIFTLIVINFHRLYQKTFQSLLIEYNHSYQIISIIKINNPLIPAGSSSNSTYKNQRNIKRRRIKLFDWIQYMEKNYIYN